MSASVRTPHEKSPLPSRARNEPPEGRRMYVKPRRPGAGTSQGCARYDGRRRRHDGGTVGVRSHGGPQRAEKLEMRRDTRTRVPCVRSADGSPKRLERSLYGLHQLLRHRMPRDTRDHPGHGRAVLRGRPAVRTDGPLPLSTPASPAPEAAHARQGQPNPCTRAAGPSEVRSRPRAVQAATVSGSRAYPDREA